MRVLIIEDEEEIREEISDILRFEGQKTVACSTGEEGLKEALSSTPDIILCDILMPGMDGFEVLSQIKKNPSTAMVPFIFITAMAERPKLRKGMEMGADDYLVKPFSRDELLKAVGTRIQKSKAQKKQLDQLREKIIYTIPHELRTPLNGILGFSRIMKEEADVLTHQDIVEMGSSIYQSASRLHEFIRKYLMFIDVEMNKKNMEWTKITIDNGNMKELTHATAEKYGRAEDLHFSLPALELEVVVEWFRFALTELIDNAFKFSDSGTKITVSAEKKNHKATISIHDEGRGFPPEYIHQINAFEQFDREIFEQQGIGLGLFLSKRIAAIHQGELKIQSTSGEGTMIHLSIPFQRD